MKTTYHFNRILALMLALFVVIGLMPAHVHAATDGTTYVLAGSDFQPTDYSTATGVTLLNQILAPIAEDYESMDGFLFAGDYDYGYTSSTAGKNALQGAVKTQYPGITHEVYVEGNHDCASRQGVDLVANGTLSPSGANDADAYGVYVIHERDFMWASNGIDPDTIQETANNLKSYLNEKRNASYTKPIFVISHLPLHYSMRTKNDGDGSHANYIFDVLNEAGNAGLNIIFMFGHNHSNGWDDYLGGAAIYLAKGDKINIAQASQTTFKEETLAFTYMNAGYVSYYRNVNTGSETDLTMTVFEITNDNVVVKRYSKDGLHDVKSKGVTNSYKNETAYDPDQTIYVSPQTIALNKTITPAGEDVENPDGGNTNPDTSERTYTRVSATSELVSGEEYLIIHNGQNDFMAPVVTSDGGSRIGFDLVAGPDGLGDDQIYGEYQDYEWTFAAVDGGWKIGTADGDITLQAADSRVAAQLTANGDTMVIGGTANSFTFTSATYSDGSYVLNYNSTADLINGYASNAATFYIYQLTDEGGESGESGESGEDAPVTSVRQIMSYDELQENVGYLIVADEGEDITLTNQTNGSGLLLSGTVTPDNVNLWYLDLTNEYIRYGSPTGSDNYLKVTNGGASVGNSSNRVTEILDNGNGTFSLYRSSYYLNRYGGSTSTKAGGYNQNNNGSKWKIYEVVLAHSYESVTVDATCAEEGSVTYTCTVCGDSYTEVIPATGAHTYATAVTAPTCTEQGYTTYTCECGHSYVSDQVAALGHSYESVTVEATCTESGSVTSTCTVCGDSNVEVLPALGHSYAAVVTAATCTEQGYTTYTCDCGDTYVSDYTDALGHTYESVTVEATCTANGSITYTCACGDTYTETVAALGHAYKAEVTAPTCTEAGYTTYTCACGDSYIADQVAALGHSYAAVVTAPTCTKQGYTTYTCDCGDTYVSDYTEVLGHAYESVTVDATCTEGGYTVNTCSNCGASSVTDATAALGHDYEVVTVDATCTESGHTIHTCAACGDSYVSNVVAALGHAYESVTVEATCTEAGSVTTSCVTCGESNVEVIPALGHDYKSVVTAPTCTEQGYTTYTCAACGDSYVETVAALGHDYKSVVTAPTCTEAGYTTYTCACGDSYVGDETAARGHVYESVTVAATCTEDGSVTYTCKCGDSYVETIAALGHTYESVVTAPTCTTAGYTTYTCACGDSYTADEVPALGHTYESVVTVPTCTTAGYTTYTCACGDSYVSDQVAALGHDYEAVTEEATCTEDGHTTNTCTVCGDSYISDVIAALGHSYQSVTVEATCTAGGYTTHTCAACGDSYTSDAVAVLGHSYTGAESDGYMVYTCGGCGDQYSEKLGYTYSQVSAISSGNNYVITVKSGNKYYALSHAGNSISAVEVTVSDGKITSEITDDLVWTYSGSKLSYTENGTTYYLYVQQSGWWSFTSYTLTVSTSNSSTVSFSSNKLKIGSRYLNYSSSKISLSSRSSTTYCFVEE